ncbi:MAG: HupE/UreJ family protein [Bacteroidota bacterium]
MNDFTLWLSTGFEHIVAWNAYDHLLFILCMVFSFEPHQYKKLLFTITAFTIGHSVSLALSTMRYIHLASNLVELLIALTILFSASMALWNLKRTVIIQSKIIYSTVLFFGLIHGLGFSSILKAMLGHETNSILPLLYFNLGIELAQILIVGCILLFSATLINYLKLNFNRFKFFSLCIILLFSLKISADRFLELFPS